MHTFLLQIFTLLSSLSACHGVMELFYCQLHSKDKARFETGIHLTYSLTRTKKCSFDQLLNETGHILEEFAGTSKLWQFVNRVHVFSAAVVCEGGCVCWFMIDSCVLMRHLSPGWGCVGLGLGVAYTFIFLCTVGIDIIVKKHIESIIEESEPCYP
jgi:hypothetical protein